MVTPTQKKRKKEKTEIDRKAKISADFTKSKTNQESKQSKGGLSSKDPAREELRNKQLKEDPKFAADVASPLKEKPNEPVDEPVDEPVSEPAPSAEDLQAQLDEQGIRSTLAIEQNDFLQRSQGLKPLDEMAAYQQTLLNVAVIGGVGLPGQFGGATSAITAGNTAQKAAQPGVKFTPVVGDAARAYATNGKTLVKTAGWMLKSGFNLKSVPVIMGALGSYPFAGFIKEEALQTLSFGIKGAKDSGDLEGEAKAIADMEEVLDPTGWNNIFNKIPYVNVLSSLKSFYEAARTKLDVDKKSFELRAKGL